MEEIGSKEKKKGFWEDFNTTSRVLALIMILECIGLIALTIDKIIDPNNDLSWWFGAVLILNCLFLLVFALQGVLNENMFELAAYIAVTIALLFYIIYQFVVGPRDIVMTIRFVVVCVCAPANTVMCWLAYRNFGWKMYRKIGASVEMLAVYRNYQQMVSLLKLDLMLGINLVILGGFSLLHGPELGIDIAAMCVTALWALLGWLSVRLELGGPLILFWLFAPVEPAYIIYKFYSVQTEPHKFIVKQQEYDFYLTLIYIMGSIAILCRIILILWVILCRKNFGKGLLNVFKREDENKPLLQQANKLVVTVDKTMPIKV